MHPCFALFQRGKDVLFDRAVLNDIHTNPFKYHQYVFADLESKLPTEIQFVETAFSNDFFQKLCRLFKKAEVTRLSDISGIGKTSTCLLFVASRKLKGENVVYIDLEEVESRKEDFEIFLRNLKSSNKCIIDHVTIANQDIIERIKKHMHGRTMIIIQTGLTDSFTLGSNTPPWEQDFALTNDEFKKIWMGSLEIQKQSAKNDPVWELAYNKDKYERVAKCCQEVFDHLKDKFVMTPRFVHYAMDICFSRLNCSAALVEFSYYRYLKQEIENFPTITENSDPRMNSFIAHTGFIAKMIVQGGLYPAKLFQDLICAVNIFTVQFEEVTKDNCEDYPYELSEGDNLVKLSFLQRAMKAAWMCKLELKPEHINSVDTKTFQNLVFCLGKEIEVSLVTSQKETGAFFLCTDVEPSTYFKRNQNFFLPEVSFGVIFLKNIISEHPSKDDLDNLKNDIGSYNGHKTKVAKYTLWLLRQISKDTSKPRLLHPNVSNFSGIDYVVYVPASRSEGNCIKSMRHCDRIYLVQVIAAQTHGSRTAAETLDVVNALIESERMRTIEVHLTFLTITKDNSSLKLKDCIEFQNISHINIGDESLMANLTAECKRLLQAFLNGGCVQVSGD